MAGLYIRNVKLPESAFDTRYLAVHQDGTVEYDGGTYGWQITTATPVPDHGRLVDADAAYDKIAEEAGEEAGNYVDMDIVGKGLEYTPTILPADKKGDA